MLRRPELGGGGEEKKKKHGRLFRRERQQVSPKPQAPRRLTPLPFPPLPPGEKSFLALLARRLLLRRCRWRRKKRRRKNEEEKG